MAHRLPQEGRRQLRWRTGEVTGADGIVSGGPHQILGLAIVRRISSATAAVWADGAIGEGARFGARLPHRLREEAPDGAVGAAVRPTNV